MKAWLVAALALFALPAAAAAQPRDAAMDAAVRDLCDRRVALLGEASHGDGATFAFKAGLIRRLVTECGYNAVLFEASHYDFVELMRRIRAREEASAAMLSSAIGGIWNRYAELAPLITFLFEEARADRLTLGGLDDQLGSAGAFYSLDAMRAELTEGLPSGTREDCRAVLRRRIYSGYPRETPDDVNMRTDLVVCAVQMVATLPDGSDAQHLAATILRLVDRDLGDATMLSRRRDESMFENLLWYAGRLGPRAKLIVWTHNAHAARDATPSTSFVRGGNLGGLVSRRWGRRAFALGFSAYGGAWRGVFSSGDEALAPAPAGTLEALALAGIAGPAAYRDGAWLAGTGRVPGRPFHYRHAPANWSRVFDGLIVFRAERPPTASSPP